MCSNGFCLPCVSRVVRKGLPESGRIVVEDCTFLGHLRAFGVNCEKWEQKKREGAALGGPSASFSSDKD